MGHHGTLFTTLSYQEPGMAGGGARHIAQDGFCPGSQLGAPGREGRMQGLTLEMRHLLLVRLLGAPQLPGPGSGTRL